MLHISDYRDSEDIIVHECTVAFPVELFNKYLPGYTCHRPELFDGSEWLRPPHVWVASAQATQLYSIDKRTPEYL